MPSILRDILHGSYRLCNWLPLRRLVSWINHSPPACWSTFWKSIFKHQLGCRFDILDSISSFFVFWHMQLYVLIHHIIFWLYLYSLNILYFFKYSYTNIFHRRSLCTFYWYTRILHRHWGVSNWTRAAVTHLSLVSGTNVPQTGLFPLSTSLSLPFEAFCPLRLSNSDILLLRISAWMAPWSGVVYPPTQSNTHSLPARPICLMWSFPNSPDAVLTCPLLGPWLGLSDSNLTLVAAPVPFVKYIYLSALPPWPPRFAAGDGPPRKGREVCVHGCCAAAVTVAEGWAPEVSSLGLSLKRLVPRGRKPSSCRASLRYLEPLDNRSYITGSLSPPAPTGTAAASPVLVGPPECLLNPSHPPTKWRGRCHPPIPRTPASRKNLSPLPRSSWECGNLPAVAGAGVWHQPPVAVTMTLGSLVSKQMVSAQIQPNQPYTRERAL